MIRGNIFKIRHVIIHFAWLEPVNICIAKERIQRGWLPWAARAAFTATAFVWLANHSQAVTEVWRPCLTEASLPGQPGQEIWDMGLWAHQVLPWVGFLRVKIYRMFTSSTASLKHKSHTTQFTHLSSTILWVWTHPQGWTTIATVNFKTFHHL